jgi:hypothetical protein
MVVVRANYNRVGLILLLAIVNILQIAAVVTAIIIIISECYTIPQKHANQQAKYGCDDMSYRNVKHCTFPKIN